MSVNSNPERSPVEGGGIMSQGWDGNYADNYSGRRNIRSFPSTPPTGTHDTCDLCGSTTCEC